MNKFFQKYWYLILTWVLALGFLVFGPRLATAFGGKVGKPVSFPETLPLPDDSITLYLDRLEDTSIVFGADQKLSGWAFLDDESDQIIYDRYLVLFSPGEPFFFPVENQPRPDVQETFHPSFSNLLDSGFTVPISSSMLPDGIYQIGLLFRNRENGSLVLTLSKLNLEHTPNTLSLVSSKIEPNPMLRSADSPQLEITSPLPPSSNSIIFYLDGLSILSADEPVQYQLFGWAFLQNEPDQEQYERSIVLQSSQATVALEASPVSRPDVKDAYKDQPGDLGNSGLSINFSTGDLAPDDYSIGILFRDPTGRQLYIASNHHLVFHDEAWHLEVIPAP